MKLKFRQVSNVVEITEVSVNTIIPVLEFIFVSYLDHKCYATYEVSELK